MQVGILGPLLVRDEHGATVEVAGTRLRSLLVRLALDAGRPVAAAALIDAVWVDAPPADAANALQTLVSRLRRTLGDAGLIVASRAGYQLALDPEAVDVVRFERLATDGARLLRAGDVHAADELLDDALALWRAPEFADAATLPGGAVARITGLRVVARIDRAAALVARGEPERAIDDLDALSGEHPLDERIAAALVTALAAAGRQADALRTYERVRTVLADELGVDPSAELRSVHLAVLRGELDRAENGAPRRTNLRAQLTSFVGRDEELARVAKALDENRLVTIVGPGGAGKTRLASEAGATLDMRDGVWLAELAGVTDGADIAQAVLGALGLREKHLLDRRNPRAAQDGQTRLVDVLADKDAVIVLDNCEHLIDASAGLAEHLLGLCPHLRVLATSREPLGIIGEVVLAVPPLGQPPADAGVELAMEYPAVRLFADRAAAARPDFGIDTRTVAAVIEIVRRLDGLPLAIELAAARLRAMPVGDIAARLSDRFRLLTGGSRTALPRHRTLRAVVEWSWGLLTEQERLLVERLAVFPAGLTSESATAVCADDRVPAADVPDLLVSLLDKSLLQRVGDGGRLRMLETIREFGAERLAERGELEQVRSRHADHFGELVEQAQPHLISAGQLPWFDRLGDERDNILAALRFRCDSNDADRALQIAVDLGAYAMMLGDHDTGPWLAEALAVPGATDTDLRWIAVAMSAMDSAAASRGTDHDEKGPGLDQIAEHLAMVSCDDRPLVSVLRPAIAFFAGLPDLTDRLLEDGLTSADPWARAAARMFRSNVAENNGDVVAMKEDLEVALEEFRALGERWGLANTLGGLGTLLVLTGRLTEAGAAFEEALDLMAELKSREDQAFLLIRLADVAMRRGDTDRARLLTRQASAVAEQSGSAMESMFMMSMLAEIERQDGHLDAARAMHAKTAERIEAMPPTHPALAHGRTISLALSARLLLDDGDIDRARTQLHDAYQASLLTRDAPIIATVGVVVATAAARMHSPDVAAEVLGAAARLRGADDRTSREIAQLTGQLQDALGRDRFDECYARGKGLDRAAATKRLDPADTLTSPTRG